MSEENINQDPPELRKKDRERIYIYSEYLKRKFYLDCTTIHVGNKYDKINNSYVKKEFNSDRDILDFICNSFNINDTERIILNKYGFPKLYPYEITISPTNTYARLFCQDVSYREFDLYEILYKYYTQQAHNFAQILCNIRDGKIKALLPKELCDIDAIKAEFCLDSSFFERIIYNLYDPSNLGNKKLNLFGALLAFLNAETTFKQQRPDFLLHNKIVSKYFLTLFSLFKITDMADIVGSTYRIPEIPKFFFFPKSKIEQSFKNIIHYTSSPASNDIQITLNIPYGENINISGIMRNIKFIIVPIIYNAKESWTEGYSADDIEYLLDYVDSPNKFNKTSNFMERIVGLYLWDKIYLNKDRKSISAAIMHYFKKYHNLNIKEGKIKRKYQRIVELTTKCIENGAYMNLNDKTGE